MYTLDIYGSGICQSSGISKYNESSTVDAVEKSFHRDEKCERRAIRSEMARCAIQQQKLRTLPIKQRTELLTEELTTYLNKGWLLAKELRSRKMLIARTQ